MSNIYSLGPQIRHYRRNNGQTLEEVSKSLSVARSYLNRIELGISRPSEELLKQIIAHFSLEGNAADQLRQMWENQFAKISKSGTGRKESNMTDKAVINSPPAANVAIDPNKPVLYSESVFIGSSEYGLTMDFAQRVGPSDQQFVVARIGMSFEHAKQMLKVLNDHLEKHER